MFTSRTSIICTSFIFFCCFLLVACTSSSTPKTGTTLVSTKTSITPAPTKTGATPAPTADPTMATPQSYTPHVLLRGAIRPDDLAFDSRGRLLFTDSYHGTVNRLNADGSVTVLLRRVGEPEGIAVLPDGTIIIAEQITNSILSLAPNATSTTVLRTLPGTPSKAHCKDGVDGVAYDPTTNTLIVPDSPIGNVYRMTLDGKNLTLLASGIVRPVGAFIDATGNIFVADECGGAVLRITPASQTTRYGGFDMPDDVVIDPQGNLLVIDLAIPISCIDPHEFHDRGS